MAGIYIPGMEMPKGCCDCRFAGDRYCYALRKANYGDIDCPLIPVPDHGRLVNVDALMEADNVR